MGEIKKTMLPMPFSALQSGEMLKSGCNYACAVHQCCSPLLPVGIGWGVTGGGAQARRKKNPMGLFEGQFRSLEIHY